MYFKYSHASYTVFPFILIPCRFYSCKIGALNPIYPNKINETKNRKSQGNLEKQIKKLLEKAKS